MIKKIFIFDTSWVFISQVITIAAGFLISVILGKFFGAATFGLFTMTLTIYTVASLVGEIGVPTAIVKYVAEFKEDKDKLNIFVSCGVINSAVFGAIVGSILFVFSGVLASIFNMSELTELIRIIAFALPFLVVNDTLLGLLNGLREMKAYSFRNIIRAILLIGFVILFIYFGLGIKGAVLALLFSEIGTLFLLIFISRNYFNFIIQDYVKTTKEIVKFGSQLFLANAIYMVNIYTDTLLVGYFLTDKDVGIYAIAIAFSKSFLVIPGAISTVVYPVISEYNNKGQYKAIEVLINKSIKYSLVILSTLGILIIFFSEDIILLLFKPEFLLAITPLTILISGMIFFGAVSSVGTAFSGIGRPDLNFKLNIPVLFVNLGIDVVLIPIFGITGAAIGTAISLLLLTILSIIAFKRLLNVKIDILWHTKITATIVLVIVTFFVFKNDVNSYLLSGILFGIYIMTVIKFLFTKKDIEYFRGVIKEVFQKIFLKYKR